MNNALKTKYLERITQLKYDAEELKKTETKYEVGNTVDQGLYYAWKTSVEFLMGNIAGEQNTYCTKVKGIGDIAYSRDFYSVWNLLIQFENSFRLDLLGEVENLVRAEIFTDFLEMAQHLLETGYKDPAAVLVSTVLENGLRRIARKHDIVVKDNDNIGSLNTKLGDAKAYSQLDRSQIQAWKKLRDSATHGKYDEYTKPKVEAMLEFVRRFLAEHLG